MSTNPHNQVLRIPARLTRRPVGPSRRLLTSYLLLLPSIVLTTLAVSAAFASAAVQFPVLGEVSGPAAGESFGSLNSESVAVNDFNGHVMVADSGAHVVYDFVSASDTVPTVWSGSAVPALSVGAGSFGGGHVGVAVDSESGDVYVADTVDLVIDKFDAEGNYLCQITGLGSASSSPTECDKTLAGPPTGAFSHQDSQSPVGIAVDQATHQLYVIDSGHQAIDVFGATGVYEKQITAVPEGLYGCEGQYADGIAVNGTSANVFVADSCTEKVFEFDALGVPVETKAFAGFVSVAVNDATGDFFVSSTSPPSVQAFKAGGAPVGQIEGVPGGAKGGVAVDQATGEIYVSDNASGSVKIFGAGVVVPEPVTGEAGGLQPSSATLHGTVNPEGVEVSDCHFDYGTSTAYGQSVPCAESPAEIGTGSEPVEVHADLSGLAVGTSYHFRLLAANANGSRAGSDETFTTLPPPAITGETASNLTATTADLNANVNPGGSELTTCEFQYGPTAGPYEHEVPCSQALAQIGSGTSPVAISVHLTELHHDTTYHWRVVAANAAGTTAGSDHTFVYNTTTEGLPDGRAYEMVTPVHKNAALLGDVTFGAQPTVAEDGSRVILPAVQCFGEASSCSVNKGVAGTPYEFTRTNQGWTATQLAPSAQQFEVSSAALTNVNRGTALFDMPSPPNGQYDFYTRSSEGLFTDIGRVTEDVTGPPGSVGPAPTGLILATDDLSHVIFGDSVRPMWPSFDKTTGPSLYEYVVGHDSSRPELVGVSGPAGSESLLSTCGTLEAGANQPTKSDSFSADGRTVFFTPELGCPGSGGNVGREVPAEGVYARVDGSETVEVSARSGSDCTGECLTSAPAGAHFEGASLDGSKVFFASTQQLTDGASEGLQGTRDAPHCEVIATASGCNLYVATLAPNSEHKTVVADLRAVSAGDSSGGGPRVQGVMAVSTDGSRVYFIARGVLSGAANGQGAVARDGGENLYVSRAGGPARFIATLAETVTDEQQWNRVGRANVTADGRFLLFTSQAPLTRDDLRPVGGPAQVFRYDAVTGSLVRISVGDNGFNDNGNAGVGDSQLAAVVIARQFTAGGAARTGPSLSADGSRVFFMSPIGLTRGALNDVKIGVDRITGREAEYAENVYEFHDGHVFLISDGRDANVLPQTACTSPATISAVCLIGTDVSGQNVFFSSADQLVSGDTDSQVDVYDARVCTGSDPCIQSPAPAPAPCDGEACHGIPAPTPGVPGGGSATFNGAGNIVPPPTGGPTKPACSTSSGSPSKACTRKQNLTKALASCRRRYPHAKKKRQTCERTAHRNYGAVKRKNSAGKRGK
jgi:hypothetical protein